MSDTLTFVLCIENNGIRPQALLLCESIRAFGGRYRQSPIWAFAPRPGLGIDAETRKRLEAMAVEYFDEPLNQKCPEYGTANRVFAGAWAEARAASEWIGVLDSDTVFLGEPELPDDADAAARPVDLKGSATSGPGDPQDDYWRRLADLGGTSVDRLPFIRTTLSHESIRASYNGGLVMVRTRKGILRKSADMFAASVAAGLRPLAGRGIDVRASTGFVGVRSSEYWGSNQAAAALAIWSSTQRVHQYSEQYNIPLHQLVDSPEIEARWRTRPPIHVHYHWLFEEADYVRAMTALGTLGVPDGQIAWLRERLPLA